MRKQTPLHFFFRLILLVMLTVMGNGVHVNAHAMHTHATAANKCTLPPELSESHQCPSAPHEQHKDYDGCDICCNCSCHAPLTAQPFQLSYNPMVLDLNTSDPFKYLPEVYLSKFIPPQILS